MIRYALLCGQAHDFEGWFGSSADYDDQHDRGLLECPVCGSKAVRKAVMAPAIAGTKAQAGSDGLPRPVRDTIIEAALAMRRRVEETFDYVGDRFAEEARAIHRGEGVERGIFGEATGREVVALLEEGVPIAPLPPLDRARQAAKEADHEAQHCRLVHPWRRRRLYAADRRGQIFELAVL
jgi:hypothetical protein